MKDKTWTLTENNRSVNLLSNDIIMNNRQQLTVIDNFVSVNWLVPVFYEIYMKYLLFIFLNHSLLLLNSVVAIYYIIAVLLNIYVQEIIQSSAFCVQIEHACLTQ